tara:strand:- start:254 stop:703 length:450 start_codon:yes stop_codon:yes gene_type:complete
MPRPLDIVTNVGHDGAIPSSHKRRIADHLMLFAGSPVRLQVTAPKRSNKANAFYWAGVIRPIQIACADAGRAVSGQGLHEYFKQLYLPVKTEMVNGTDVVIPLSTTKLDSTAFHDFIESIRTDEFVLALGVYFDEPEEFSTHKIDDLPY